MDLSEELEFLPPENRKEFEDKVLEETKYQREFLTRNFDIEGIRHEAINFHEPDVLRSPMNDMCVVRAGACALSGRTVRQFVYVTFYTHTDKKIVPMYLHEDYAKKQIEEKAAELLPTVQWKIFSGTQHQAVFEFKDSRQIMNAIKRSPICKFYYLLVRLERLHPIRADLHEAKCDECGRMIVGHRYKCTSCADFDICQSCESKSLHSEHAMLRIVKNGITEIPRYITANAPRYVFPYGYY